MPQISGDFLKVVQIFGVTYRCNSSAFSVWFVLPQLAPLGCEKNDAASI
jgi:hypothetical protein